MIDTDKHVETADGAQVDASAVIPPLELQPASAPGDADEYRLEELLRFHDRAFVAHAYAALCRRAPTAAELARTLDDLRSGRRTKSEIVEGLCADGTRARVAGLPSPALRRLSRWPLVGHLLRWLRALARLPVLLQHQQQFEAYALAQQQRIADYLNEVVAPAVAARDGAATATDSAASANDSLAATVADAVESVMMLSDSLVEVTGRQAELQGEVQQLQAQLRYLQAQQQQSEMQLHADLLALTEALTAQQQQSEMQLHADLSALTEALTAQQQRLAELRREHDANAAAQREFLVHEQRVIVEAQRVVLGELQEQLHELTRAQAETRAALAAEVDGLRALVEPPRAAAGANEGATEREQR